MLGHVHNRQPTVILRRTSTDTVEWREKRIESFVDWTQEVAEHIFREHHKIADSWENLGAVGEMESWVTKDKGRECGIVIKHGCFVFCKIALLPAK